ncbi:hypothetical protein VB776_21245 [Arcicella sp. DC2W]|uniref:QacE n=1 Tax=Arcicella gelida TaxID=2984195 RepID=A0ABU5SAH6_9BACT|nr:hypothetical protein [Arcicella sp. DC2W]MEA5405479.1 hypothetical protein [Arcicella sp. DC2W]
MKLFPNEKIVLESDNKSIILTTHRIFQQSDGLGSQETTSIMLEHISSCQTYVQFNWILIGIAICVGMFSLGSGSIELGIFLCGVLLATFYLTKKSMILIKSPTATIKIDTGNMNTEAISKFVDKVEQTKYERVTNINTKSN